MDIFISTSSSSMFHYKSSVKQDIDVLFYGAESPRRRNMEVQLNKIPNCRVVFRYYNLFRSEREELIRRSKIVLNLHYWPESSLEVHRIEYACSRSKCIISEPSSDTILDYKYQNCVKFAKYNDIPSTVKTLLGDKCELDRLGIHAQDNAFNNQFDTSAIKACISSL